MDKNVAQGVANILIKIRAVSFCVDKPFVFTSGLKSPIYLDNRIIMSYPEERSVIVDYYAKRIYQIGLDDIDYISATATAAIPQGAWIADKLSLPMVYCRSSRKAHGKQNQIEGDLKSGSNVIVIEDHISTGGSCIENAKAIRELGCTVKHVVATSTYESDASIKNLKNAGLKLHALTTGKIIVEEAYKQGLVTVKERKSVEQWFAHPQKWSDKQK